MTDTFHPDFNVWRRHPCTHCSETIWRFWLMDEDPYWRSRFGPTCPDGETAHLPSVGPCIPVNLSA